MPPLEALEGDPDTDELAFLVACRRVPLAELTLAVPAGAARRLDGMVRAEAERPLRALHFYRSLGESGG
jgi:hypothetical protein